MWKLISIVIVSITSFSEINCSFPNPYPRLQSKTPKGDAGDPLFLTPFIEQGKLEEGRQSARVIFTEQLGVKSYSGFFTVNKKYDSNQFFWYFPTLAPNKNTAPVVLWLQGGPGATSLFGLFTENGPIIARKDGFERRKYNWALNHHVIYIDNPVGTGFSFTNASEGYAKNQKDVGRDLYETMLQFFQLFPDLQQNEFFVTGESYAGKYVPALAYTIHNNNKDAKQKINLKGFAIGNGFTDPEHQLEYGKYIYQLGLIDSNQLKQFEEYEQKGIKLIQTKQWEKAFELFDDLLDGDLNGGKSLFRNITGFEYYFNYLQTKDDTDTSIFATLLERPDVRKAIHVGSLPFNNGKLVELHLKQDIMQSVAPWVVELLNHYIGVLYNGQLDIIVAYPLTENYLKNLNFSGAEKYKTAHRYIWKVDGEVAGYVKHAGNLTEILVRNAGHMVPADQPKWALDLITRVTHEKSFY